MNKRLAEYAASDGRPDESWLSTGAPCAMEMESFEELVEPDRACTCGERRMDWLIWDDCAINVTCATCGEIFRPGGAR